MRTILLAGLAAAALSNAIEAEQTLFTNGVVYTVDKSRTVAEAVLIDGDKIIAVGSNADLARIAEADAKRIDLQGRLMLPGLHDTHIHALGTIEPEACDFKSKPYSLAEMVPFLKGCLDTYAPAPGDWLLVHQWNFSEGNQPSAEYPSFIAALDAVSTEHPIMLMGNDGHHGAANSAALALATAPDGTKAPISAETIGSTYAQYKDMIAVDSNGHPTGGIHEGARNLLRDSLLIDMVASVGDPAVAMPKVAQVLASRGITSIHDPAVTPKLVDMYKALEDMGGMTFRMRAGFLTEPKNSHTPEGVKAIGPYVESLKDVRARYADSKYIRADGVKLFADAVLEGDPYATPPTLPVAAVLDGFKQPIFKLDAETGKPDVVGYVNPDGPECAQAGTMETQDFQEKYGYSPRQCNVAAGGLEHSEAYIHAFVRATTDAGFNVHVHALSDKGVRVAVDALTAAKASADKQGLTQSLAHMQLVHPEDQKRIGELGLYAAFTYIWAVPFVDYDMTVIPFIDHVQGAADLYNPDHYYMQNVYPTRSVQGYGAILTGASDAPVGSRDPMPFAQIAAAITRSGEGQVYNAAERLSIEDAVAAYTINGAAMLGIADITGSIEPGKAADLIVLDRNILELGRSDTPEAIYETRVIQTYFDGNLVFDVGK